MAFLLASNSIRHFPRPVCGFVEECFPKEILADQIMLSAGMPEVCGLKAQIQIDSGLIGYRQPSYEEALAEVTDTMSEISRMLEAPPCTVVLGWSGGGSPHGGSSWMCLIYKPGSTVGEGEIVYQPMPRDDAWGNTAAPGKLWLSEDGLTLYYSYYYDQRSIIDEGLLSERLIHEAGTYIYTVDLNTGKNSLTIIPDRY
jgi:hypothetical protein